MVIRFTLPLIVLASIPAFAADPIKEIKDCSAIDIDEQRLNCYDTAIGRTQPQPTSVGNWTVIEDTSPVDDRPIVNVSIEADGELSGWLITERPTLILRCKENRTEAFVHTGMTDAGDDTRIRYRLDKDKVVDQRWSNSTSGQAVFYPGNSVNFIKKLTGHATMYFEVWPFNASATSTTFNLSGIEDAIVPLKKVCNWN